MRYKIIIGLVLSILVGLLDGLGLAMFMPLLGMVNGDSSLASKGTGNIRFLINFLENINVSLSLENVLLFILFFFTLKGIANYFSNIYRVLLQQELIRKIRLLMLQSLNNVSFNFFINSDPGRIQNTMTGEVDRIQQAYNTYFQAVEQIILVLVYMTFAFLIDSQFAILIFLGGVVSNFMYKFVYSRTKGASIKLTVDSNLFQGKVIQYVANFKYLRATGLTDIFSKRLETVIFKIESSRKKIGSLGAILHGTREPLMMLVVTLVILFQVNYLNGSLGPILISLLFFYRALTALTQMQNAWNRFLGVSGSLDNLQNFQISINQNHEIFGNYEFQTLVKDICIENMSFSYGDNQILNKINLSIVKNQSIAIVGESGSGKTTLVNSICGLHPVSKGVITIDGKKLNSFDRASFQKRIGYITQEPVIFNDSIFNNVTCWADRNKLNEQKCMEAIKKASLGEFVLNSSEGIGTMLGNNGINLSGGQKQRISIARELYKDIDILILDEATSALDSETELIIKENIDSLKGKYTIIVIAHRLSTIKNMDNIIILEKGKIIGNGNFDSLLKSSNKFNKMVQLQEVSSL
ncbi:ABC transporter ATP-binding protein/permease [Flavobacteriaceae bacterium]|nr:ABC transporter ATP-binding protein/permease [Flavobacteriaceae bacterium]